MNIGHTHTSFRYLCNKVKYLDSTELLVTLQLDEIHINPKISYDSGQLYGNASNRDQQQANRIQTFMISYILSTNNDVVSLVPIQKMTAHDHNNSVQAHKPLQMIKALTATGWGKQKETLMAVMRPAREYASSIWSSLASLTSINKLQVMHKISIENCHRMHTRHKLCITKHSYFPYTSNYSSMRHNTTENTTSITSLTQSYNILQHSKAQKHTIFNNGCYTTNIPTDPTHSHYNRHKNKHAPYTYIYCLYVSSHRRQ